MTEGDHDILFSGNVQVNQNNKIELDPKVQHLGCFVGGMIGIGSKIFGPPEDLTIARKLVDGCIWAYENTVTGIMPEIFQALPCSEPCHWDQQKWHSAIASSLGKATQDDSRSEQQRVEAKILQDRLRPGVVSIPDRRYILR